MYKIQGGEDFIKYVGKDFYINQNFLGRGDEYDEKIVVSYMYHVCCTDIQ